MQPRRKGVGEHLGPPAGDPCAFAHGMQSCCFAAHKKAQLCRVFLYPDPAPVGRDIRVSKGGFKGTALRI